MKAAGESLEDLKQLHKDIATLVVAEAQHLVPRKNETLAGTIRAAGSKTAATVKAGSKRVPYAGMIQWGRKIWPSTRGPKPASGRKKHPSVYLPSLFLTEAASASEPEWVGMYIRQLENALAEATGEK
jgi:hypothetical protein